MGIELAPLPIACQAWGMLITILPFLIAIIGVLAYALSSNAKVSEIGRILFFCGILVTIWALSGHTIKVF